MNTFKNFATALSAGVGLLLTLTSVFAQPQVISSLSQNGSLSCSGLQPGTSASIEWASSVLGPWTTDWKGLESVLVDSNGRIQVDVPMFYRVRGIPAPSPSLGKATFTKWVTANPNLPGRILDMAGVVGGNVGTGVFAGEVLLYNPAAPVSHFVAFYHFTGPQHSFTALVDVLQTGDTNGSTAAITGVVTDGWMQGHAVAGEFTQIAIDHAGGTGYQGFLAIKTKE